MLIHHICLDGVDQEQVGTWKEKNPGMEQKIWDTTKTHVLVKKHFPEYLELYESKPGFRFDLCRWLILYQEGGFFVDLSLEPINLEKIAGLGVKVGIFNKPVKLICPTAKLVYAIKGHEYIDHLIKLGWKRYQEKGQKKGVVGGHIFGDGLLAGQFLEKFHKEMALFPLSLS